MADSNSEEWNFHFGRGGGGNQKRQVSKANILVKDLALRYSYCRQTEKRLFAKKEVYDNVIRNGGVFFNVVNRKPVDITADADEVINRIMQGFRDINKHCRKSPQLPLTSPKTRKSPLTKISSPTMPIPISRPKRRCIRPSIIEPPIIESERDARSRVVKTDKAIPSESSTPINLGTRNTPGGIGEPRQKSFNETGIGHLGTDDAFEKMAVEPPKLENSFSALIMTDEITADLPRDSQQSINQNLHNRVQRLENLVAMLMQQKNDEMERLLT
jgi:hypothetical protein